MKKLDISLLALVVGRGSANIDIEDYAECHCKSGLFIKIDHNFPSRQFVSVR